MITKYGNAIPWWRLLSGMNGKYKILPKICHKSVCILRNSLCRNIARPRPACTHLGKNRRKWRKFFLNCVFRSGQPCTEQTDETRIWQRHDSKWLNVHFHRSDVPNVVHKWRAATCSVVSLLYSLFLYSDCNAICFIYNWWSWLCGAVACSSWRSFSENLCICARACSRPVRKPAPVGSPHQWPTGGLIVTSQNWN